MYRFCTLVVACIEWNENNRLKDFILVHWVWRSRTPPKWCWSWNSYKKKHTATATSATTSRRARSSIFRSSRIARISWPPAMTKSLQAPHAPPTTACRLEPQMFVRHHLPICTRAVKINIFACKSIIFIGSVREVGQRDAIPPLPGWNVSSAGTGSLLLIQKSFFSEFFSILFCYETFSVWHFYCWGRRGLSRRNMHFVWNGRRICGRNVFLCSRKISYALPQKENTCVKIEFRAIIAPQYRSIRRNRGYHWTRETKEWSTVPPLRVGGFARLLTIYSNLYEGTNSALIEWHWQSLLQCLEEWPNAKDTSVSYRKHRMQNTFVHFFETPKYIIHQGHGCIRYDDRYMTKKYKLGQLNRFKLAECEMVQDFNKSFRPPTTCATRACAMPMRSVISRLIGEKTWFKDPEEIFAGVDFPLNAPPISEECNCFAPPPVPSGVILPRQESNLTLVLGIAIPVAIVMFLFFLTIIYRLYSKQWPPAFLCGKRRRVGQKMSVISVGTVDSKQKFWFPLHNSSRWVKT